MRARSVVTLLSCVLSLSLVRTAGAADYGVKGAVATTTTSLAAGFAGASGGKLVVPNAPGSYPLVVASHGFSANADNQVGWAEHFASYGFVVVVPSFPNTFSPDHAKNGGIVKALVSTLPGADTPAKGKIDATRIGLEGHSAGGLATTLAAADLSPAATVLFDPVDNAGAGKAAYAKLCGPVLGVFAGPSSCNNSSGWFDFRTTAKGPTTSFRVKSATHCDGENLPRSLCGLTCGGAADAGRQKLHAHYATAFLLANLKGDAAAAAELALAKLSADATIGEVSVGGGASCVTGGGSDAGVTDSGVPDSGTAEADAAGTTDAGGTDAGVTDSGKVEADAAGSGDDASSPATDAGAELDGEGTSDGGGCACSTPARPVSSVGGLVALGLAAVVAARRRRA